MPSEPVEGVVFGRSVEGFGLSIYIFIYKGISIRRNFVLLTVSVASPLNIITLVSNISKIGKFDSTLTDLNAQAEIEILKEINSRLKVS